MLGEPAKKTNATQVKTTQLNIGFNEEKRLVFKEQRLLCQQFGYVSRKPLCNQISLEQPFQVNTFGMQAPPNATLPSHVIGRKRI